MNFFLRTSALVTLALMMVTLVACGGPSGGTGNSKLPTGPSYATVEGQIAVPADFLAETTLAELMDSGRVWLVDTQGEFLLSSTPDTSGAFELKQVPAGVAGQRLLAIFGSGDDAVSLEALLGPLPATSNEVPSVSVNISLASTVQAEVLQDPELAEQLRSDVLNSLSSRDRMRLSSFALEPLDLEDSANMITIVSDTSSLGNPSTTGTGLGTQADECAWWNPLSWTNCWETPDLQVQNGGRTSNTVRRPPVPQNYAMGLEYQSNTAARIIAAGGGNIIATGGGNIIAAGGGKIIAAGGGNIIATGGGNIIATGGLNSHGNSLDTLSNGVEVVRRVDFGDVLAKGEIGELRRFGPQILSDFVIVPANLFDKYSNDEVAFIAKNISWAGERGREAAERIIADMRARKSAADEIQASFRKAAQLPPITLPTDARKHSAPELVYVKTSAGKAALAAPVIVSAQIPSDDSAVVEISTRNVTAGMAAYWRAEDGSFERQDLALVKTGVYRTPLSQNGYRNLMVAAVGPTSPYSNLVRVAVQEGSVTTPGLDVQGFEGIGGQGGSDIDFVFEDGTGSLFIADMQKVVLNLPSGESMWTSVSDGLSPALYWENRNGVAMGASDAGDLFFLVEGQAYELENDGSWTSYGPELFDPQDNTCFGGNGLVDREGGIYTVFRCSGSYTLYYLDPTAVSWTPKASMTDPIDGQMHLGADGRVYFLGRGNGGWGKTQVYVYEPGKDWFDVSFSSTTHAARVEQLTVDNAGNLLLLADPTDTSATEDYRIYFLGLADSAGEWSRLEESPLFEGFRPTQLARPSADGALYATSSAENTFSRSLYKLPAGSSTWSKVNHDGFVAVEASSSESVTHLWPGQNGSLLVLANDLLFRLASDGGQWEDLSRGMSGTGTGPDSIAFAGDELLVSVNGRIYATDSDTLDWSVASFPGEVFGSGLAYDLYGKQAFGWGSFSTSWFRRSSGNWDELTTSLPSDQGLQSVAVSPNGTVYALASGSDGRMVYAYDGSKWTALSEPNQSVVLLDVNPEGELYSLGYEGVHVYNASDGSWSAVGYLYMAGSVALDIDFASEGTIYASWRGNGFRRWNTVTAQWEVVDEGLPSSNGEAYTVHDLVVDGKDRVYGATSWGVYLLEPGASAWAPVPGLADVSVFNLEIGPDNRLYASTGQPGVFRSIP